ncbi:MAG: hypothetical protein O7G87_22170 [bacterium]|nr:hypothetical protein [bacterium]
MKQFLMVLGCLIGLLGCQAERDKASLFGPEEVGVLVIDAQLIVDKPLPALFVRETVGLGEVYRLGEAGVVDAEVVIEQDGQRFVYRADLSEPGRYIPPTGPPQVLPQTTYRLTVRSQGREARATTRTPGRLVMRETVWQSEDGSVERRMKTFEDGEVYSAPENQIVYQDGLLVARFGALDAKGYQVAIESLDPNSKLVVESEFIDDENDVDRYGSSPPFEIADGNLPMPWFIVFFEGRHLIRFYAVDENWFDLIRSVPQFHGEDGAIVPGGLAGDNFERPLFHVEGGIGLFGSASTDSLGFVVLPRPGR